MSSKELLEVKNKFWQPFYEDKLALQETENISNRLNIFFGLLAEETARERYSK